MINESESILMECKLVSGPPPITDQHILLLVYPRIHLLARRHITTIEL